MEERVLVEKKWEIKFGWVKGIWAALVAQIDTDCQVVCEGGGEVCMVGALLTSFSQLTHYSLQCSAFLP